MGSDRSGMGKRHEGFDAAVREDAQGRQVAASAERAEGLKRSLKAAGFRLTRNGVVKDVEASAAVFWPWL